MLPLFDQIYLVAAGVGFIFVVVGFLVGQMEGDGGDSGDFGSADNNSGDFSSSDNDAAGDFSGVEANHGQQHSLVRAMRTGTGIYDKREQGPVMTILRVISPTTIAIFLFCFGFSGIVFSRTLPFLGWFSLLPAILGALILQALISRLLSKITRSLHTSTNFREESVIGLPAEATCAISAGRMGEITFRIGASRQTGPARAAKDGVQIAKTQQVIICDVREGVFFVEPSDEV